MYLIMAMIWLFCGVLVQIFWTDLEPVMRFRMHRMVAAVLCTVLVLYNLMRWRLTRVDVHEPPPPPPRQRRTGEYDPNLDFTRLEEPKADKKEPPAS